MATTTVPDPRIGDIGIVAAVGEAAAAKTGPPEILAATMTERETDQMLVADQRHPPAPVPRLLRLFQLALALIKQTELPLLAIVAVPHHATRPETIPPCPTKTMQSPERQMPTTI